MAAIAWLAQEKIHQNQQTALQDNPVTRLVSPRREGISLSLTCNSICYSLTVDCTPDGYRIHHEQTDACIQAHYGNDTLALDLGTHITKSKVFADSEIAIVYKNGSSYLFNIVNDTSKRVTP